MKPKTVRLWKRNVPDVQLNLNVRGLPISATIDINERCQKLISKGRTVYKLGLGQSPFPVPDCVVKALQENAGQKDYLPVKGLPKLREVVAREHARYFRVDCTPEDVLVGPGSKELMFLLQLVYYGDLVIPTPSWVSYSPQAQIIGRQVRMLPTRRDDDWCLKAEKLEQLCSEDPGRPRIVILNYPANPTGGTYTVKELRALAATARRHRVILLSDEIYARLHHDGRHQSIVPFYPEGTIFSSGLSKWCGAGGWRLGVFVFPQPLRWLLEAMAAVASETFTATSAPIQYAAVRAFEGGEEIDHYLYHSRRVLKALGRWAARRLQETGIYVKSPEGGFYLFPDFSPMADRLRSRGITTSDKLVRTLLDDTGVAILPGTAFGRPARELTARIAYVNFDGAGALQGAAQTANGGILPESFLREHCRPAMDAIERLCAWISA